MSETKHDDDLVVHKTIDDFCVYSETLASLERQIEKIVKSTLSDAVKF